MRIKNKYIELKDDKVKYPLLKAIRTIIRQSLCDHEYYSDTQIAIIRCEKCGDERWYRQKSLW